MSFTYGKRADQALEDLLASLHVRLNEVRREPSFPLAEAYRNADFTLGDRYRQSFEELLGECTRGAPGLADIFEKIEAAGYLVASIDGAADSNHSPGLSFLGMPGERNPKMDFHGLVGNMITSSVTIRLVVFEAKCLCACGRAYLARVDEIPADERGPGGPAGSVELL